MFNQVVRDIKDIRIQGAANIALSAVDAVTDYFSKKNFRTKKALVAELDKRNRMLLATRPNEPMMMNALRYIRKDLLFLKGVGEAKEALLKNALSIKMIISESRKNISSAGAGKIANNSKIFTHCHSSSVVGLLKMAKERGVSFEVYNSETRPLYQGRKTAKELAKEGIRVFHMVDSAFNSVMNEMDYVLVGCDVITSELSIVNKIGTYLLATMAKEERVPFYVVGELLKFDPETIFETEQIEQRGGKEVWKNPPKGVKILNPAFEFVPKSLITGFITEFGVFAPEIAYSKIKEKYPWIF